MADIADTRALHASSPHAEAGEEHESFRDQVRARVIGLGSMDRRLRLVVGAAIAQLIVAAIMVALRDAHLPSVIGDVTDNEESLIPTATFVVAVVFLTIAWSFLLAGALHAHWLLRIPALALFVWAFYVERDTVTDRPAGTVAAVVLMAAIVAVTVASILRDRRAGAPPQSQQRLLVTRLLPLLPLIGGLFLTAWIGSQSADQLENFTTAVSQQLYNLEYVLIPVLILAGADFADWGHLLGERAGEVLHRARADWPLLLGTAVVGAAMLADAVRVLHGDAPRAIGLGAILLVAFLLLVWLARPRAAGHAHLPFAVLAGVVVLDATLGFLVEQHISGSEDYVSDHVYASSALMWAAFAVLGILLLLSRRGRLPLWLVLSTVFVVLVAVCNVLFGLSSVASVFPGLHLSADSNPLDLDGVRAIAGIATLGAVAVVVLTRRGRGSATRVLAAVLAADVGIQVLAWVDQLFNRSAEVADKVTRGFSVWAAVVLLAALLLEILGSGEAITNRHDRGFPRQSRVLLYLGYVVLVAASVLYFASLHDPANGTLRESQFDSETWVHQGLLFLGVPLVLTLLLGGLLRTRHRAEAAAAAGEAAVAGSPA